MIFYLGNDDYLFHVDMYREAGHDLSRYPRVGVGSVCLRQGTWEAVEIIGATAKKGITPHTFGFKKTGLQKCWPIIGSSDSLAWSTAARRGEPLPGCTHKHCSACLKYALIWRRNLLNSLGESSLFLWDR